jgi:uncharacterized protein YuzE
METLRSPLRVTYDGSVNAAYIYLKHPIEPGEAAKTYCCDEGKVGGMINLDFDAEGKLIGIEVLFASHMLPKKLLDAAERIG